VSNKSNYQPKLIHVADRNPLLTELLSAQVLHCIFLQAQYMLRGLLNCSSTSFLVVLDHPFPQECIIMLALGNIQVTSLPNVSHFVWYCLISSSILFQDVRVRPHLSWPTVQRLSPISGTSWQVFLSASCLGVSAPMFPPHRGRTQTPFIMHFSLYFLSHVFLNVYLNSSF
jgi:hypothetical protein